MSAKHYRAIVEKIILDGKHGPYAVAREDRLGVVTFSLDRNVWREKKFPEPGTCVILSDLVRKSAGWRAENARLFSPSDEQQTTSKKRNKSNE